MYYPSRAYTEKDSIIALEVGRGGVNGGRQTSLRPLSARGEVTVPCPLKKKPVCATIKVRFSAHITLRIFQGEARTIPKYVYFFVGKAAEGVAGDKNLLGGKGANLAECHSIQGHFAEAEKHYLKALSS